MVQLEGMSEAVLDFVCKFKRGAMVSGEEALAYARLLRQVEPEAFSDVMDETYTHHMLYKQIDVALELAAEHQATEAAKSAIRTSFYYVLKRHIADYYDMLADDAFEDSNK